MCCVFISGKFEVDFVVVDFVVVDFVVVYFVEVFTSLKCEVDNLEDLTAKIYVLHTF